MLTGTVRHQSVLYFGVPRRKRAPTPCLFCGNTASPSREHVIPRWVNKALGVQTVVEERRGTVRRLDALGVVLPQVCVQCNTGWMHELEQRTAPVLRPMLLGAALPVLLDPAQQSTLATWAVKTSLLLTCRKFKTHFGGWIPSDNLRWLHLHGRSDLPPPGARVWLGGIRPRDSTRSRNLSASVQAGCMLDRAANPVAHFGTFSLGHVLFQVFCCEAHNSVLSHESETWLAPTEQFRSALIQIAPSSADVSWPPDAVFATDAVEIVGERLRAPPPGLWADAEHT
jgi:hypothetical protein